MRPRRVHPDPSDSKVQRDLESVMLRRLAAQHPDWRRVAWNTTSVELGLLPVWQRARPDAVWKTRTGEIIVAESYAHVDALKAGHRRKLAMDALKLLSLRATIPKGRRVRCLLVVPGQLMGSLKSDGWFPAALGLAAEIVPVDLSRGDRIRLNKASRLQAQAQARLRRVRKALTE